MNLNQKEFSIGIEIYNNYSHDAVAIQKITDCSTKAEAFEIANKLKPMCIKMVEKPFVEFFVPGLPATAGSKKGFGFKGKDGKIHVSMAPDNPRQKPWMSDVKLKAEEAFKMAPVRGPVRMELIFYFTRPKSHYGTGKNSDKLKPSSPEFHIVKPDVSKLTRAVEDAMKGVVYIDDCQIYKESHEKKYGQRPGVLIRIFLDQSADLGI